MTNRKRFTIDVSKDEDENVDISVSTNQDISCKTLDYEDVVSKLEEVFIAMKQHVTG